MRLASLIMRHRHLLLQWLVPLSLVAAWQLSAYFDLIPRHILPAPFDVLRAASRLTASREMASHIRISTFRAGTGFLIGGSIGLTLGILTETFPAAEILFDSTLQMIRNIPHLALLPLIILWFGIGEKAKIILVALGVFFPVYLNTYHGVRNADPHLLEIADRVVILDRGRVVMELRVPLPRPRERGAGFFPVLEGRLLRRILSRPAGNPDSSSISDQDDEFESPIVTAAQIRYWPNGFAQVSFQF
jgi:sulfonate transport system permease protein